MEKIRKINKSSIIIIFYSIVLSLFLSMEISFGNIDIHNILNINISLTLIIMFVLLLISSFFIFDRKKVTDFIYKYRYLLACIVFILLVLGKFHCTSIGIWNDYIQPNYDYSDKVVISTPKSIRSDEWLVNSPLMFSQKYVNYNINNDLVRADKTNIYLLSTAPVLDLLEIARPLSLGVMLFGNDYGISIWWFGRVFALFFTTFELLMILTKKNKKISLFGSILVLGSSVIQWFFASYITEILIGGQLALISFYYLIKSESKLKKVLWSFVFAIGMLDYCLILYPAHQIPFGYIFVIIALWMIFDNKENNVIKKNIKYMICPIIIVLTVLIRFFLLSKEGISAISNSVYPGHRFTNGGNWNEWQRLFQYPYTMLLPFKSTGDACTISSFLSLFPLPLIIAIYYLVKNKKQIKKEGIFSKNFLVIGLVFLEILYLAFCIFKLPSFIVKVTLLSKTTVNAICAPIGFICILLMCILMDKVKFNKKNEKIMCLVISLLLSLFCVYVSYSFMSDYVNKYICFALFLIFSILNYLYLTNDKKIKQNVLIICMSCICFVNIIYVNPLTIGTDMIYKKPLANEINKIISNDKDSRWIALDSFITPNYLMMNGAKTINSTNLYPNLKLWIKIDKNGKYENVYNRYAHTIIDLTSEETSFELIQPDLMKINLNYDDIKALDINYIYSNKNIDIDNKYNVNLVKIYEDDGSYIYKVGKNR